MRYHRYKLINLLYEEIKDDEDTKQIYDDGNRAGKPDANASKADYNLNQVANSIAAAVKSHTDVKTKLNAKNMTASGRLTVKAGKDVKVSGSAELDMRTGKADLSVPIMIKGKSVNLNIQGLNVSNPKDIYDKDIKGSFTDPISNRKITVGVNINPNKGNYSFDVGEQKNRVNFGINVNINKSNYSAGGKVGFDSSDFIPGRLAPKIDVGVDYDNTGGLSGNIVAKKDFSTRRGGTVSVSGQGRIKSDSKSVGFNLAYAPENKKNSQKMSKADKLVTKGISKASRYVDFGDASKGGKLKTVKGRDGKKTTKVAKEVGDTIDRTQKFADNLKENKISISRNKLRVLIEHMLIS